MTAKKDKNYVLRMVKENKIKFIRLCFTDVLGFLKSFDITADELPLALEEGTGFDGSSIEGFARIEESDVMALPDPSTFHIMPANIGEEGVARMFCDVLDTNGKPYPGDPRYVLKRNLARAQKLGFKFFVGPELEYFYFKDKDTPEPLERAGYFDAETDILRAVRKETALTLEAMGIPVECTHHEVASSQHEIDLRYTDALTMADNVMTYRLVVKEVARKHGVYATFMPKPLFGINGSGMHVHMSLFKGNRNAFFDPKDKQHLSKTAKAFTAGILRHVPELTAITNQWVNSYKRLVPGYEAPVYICWAQMNRSALVRIPAYRKGKEKATRVEFRSPDPSCNPYLAFAAMLAAGLEGIEKKYTLGNPATDNIYHMGEEQRKKKGIHSLPDDLYEAIKLTEQSKLIKQALGENVFQYFILNKKLEWNEYKAQVSKYEIDKYYSIL